MPAHGAPTCYNLPNLVVGHMRIIIASDIHGRLQAAKKFEALVKAKRPDHIILLGDYLYNGPRNGVPFDYDPMAVANILNKFASITIGVNGNCDSRIDASLLRFPIPNSRIIKLDGHRCDLVHGDLLTSDLLDVLRGDILMFGHTHVYMLKQEDGVTYLNPGSISFPKNGNPPTYAMMEDGVLSIHSLDAEETLASLTL